MVAYQRGEAGSIAHAERFVLVDQTMTIRAYFDANDAAQRDLVAAARKLVAAQ